MAVVTIDAKAELAEIQASLDAEAAAEQRPAPATQKKAEEPATKEAAVGDKPAEDPDDIEGEDGLTPREKRELSAKMLKAIGKRTAQRRDAEEFAAAQYAERRLAEQRAAALERENADLKAKAQPEPEKVDPEAGKPTRDKFDSDQAYWDAYVDWRAERKAEAKIKEERARAAAAEAERQQAALLETAKSRIGRALELVPDFRDVTEAADLEVPPVVAGYMQKSEMFAEIGYHLAKNPDVLIRLSKLPPDEQLVTIGKIEGTLKPFEPKGSKTTDGAKPSTSAANGKDSHEAEPSETGSTPSMARSSAPVITPLNGNSGAAVQIDPRDMNTREMISDWAKTHRVNFGLRKRH